MYEQAGDPDRAIDWYRIVYEERDRVVPYLGVLTADPAVRAHPRFFELLREIQLDAWAEWYSTL
ncbi:MAG: hypothetical protein ACE5F8_09045 [Woeseiaceae bacterium]